MKILPILGEKIKEIISEAWYDSTLMKSIQKKSEELYTGKLPNHPIPSGTKWSTVQDEYPEFANVCQTKKGIIGPTEFAHPGEEEYNWSIVNRFDSNGLVHDRIKELHKSLAPEENLITWFENNAYDFLAPDGKYTRELAELNKRTFIKGLERENKGFGILSDRFKNTNIKKFCSGAKEDFTKGKDLVVTSDDGRSFSVQVKPFFLKKSFMYVDERGAKYYKINSKNFVASKYKNRNVQGFMFIDNDEYVLFSNDPRNVFSSGDYTNFYEEPLMTNINFENKTERKSKQTKIIKSFFNDDNT